MPPEAPAQRQRRPVGRRSRLTDEITVLLAENIGAGNSVKAACDRVGVNDGLVRRWRDRGQAEIDRLDANPDAIAYTIEAPYRALSAAVTQAMADAEAGRVVRILEAGRPHEVTKRIETTRHVLVHRRDAQGRAYQDLEQVTDVRVEVATEFDWRADAWWLEHARPGYWGRSKIDLTVTDERADGESEPDLQERAAELLDELARRRVARDADAAAASG